MHRIADLITQKQAKFEAANEAIEDSDAIYQPEIAMMEPPEGKPGPPGDSGSPGMDGLNGLPGR